MRRCPTAKKINKILPNSATKVAPGVTPNFPIVMKGNHLKMGLNIMASSIPVNDSLRLGRKRETASTDRAALSTGLRN